MNGTPTALISPAFAAFLAQHGHSALRLTAFTADASPRRYYRLEGQGVILMEDPTGSRWDSKPICGCRRI